MKITIIGGSIAGLCAGIALTCKGYEVDIYERSAASMESRGAGLIVQPDMMNYILEHHITTRELFGVPAFQGQVIDRTGRAVLKYPIEGSFTSWNHLWKHLKAHFPVERYHFSHPLAYVAQRDDQAHATFADGTTVSSDLLLGADGYQSLVRQYLLPRSEPEYAGYIAYRGLLPEQQMTPEEVALLAGKISFFPYEHSRMLTYLIPGPDGELTPGNRLLNWVWAVNKSPQELAELMTDKNGQPHKYSVPPAFLSSDSLSGLTQLASQHLPEVFQQLIAKTEHPFIQAIVDLAVPKMFDGRVAILGDAAFVVRPHTGSGTSKAYGDAITLAESLFYHTSIEAALAHWESDRKRHALKLYKLGQRLALQSGFGVE